MVGTENFNNLKIRIQMDKKQKRYNKLLALNGKEMPDNVEANEQNWTRIKTFKHDFFAATGLYKNEKGEKAVLKIFRTHSYLYLPYQLLSILEARHETKIYKRLQDTGKVPKFLGRVGRCGILHEYVEGKDLLYDVKIDKDFFDGVEVLLKIMHKRGIAYVDTNKPDNILCGDDGKGYLIDFQISWVQPPFPLNILTYPIYAILKDSDLYHMRKHRRKFFPESMTKEELNNSRPWYIKLHRKIANPIRWRRRKYLRSVESEAPIKPDGVDKH